MGRIEELLSRGLLRLHHLRTLVLDEVDELLQGGFSGNLAALIKRLPEGHRTLLFSATVSQDVERVARKFMRDPLRLQLAAARELPTELSHRVLRTNVKHRMLDLAAFLRAERPYQLLLFCGTRHEAEEVQEGLVELGFEAEFLHGELSPAKRRRLIQTFRDGELPILVASDLAARGLDLSGVDLVINYSFPRSAAEYLHRAGRTGRAGRPGVVVTLLIEQQQDRFENLRQTFEFQKVELHGDQYVVRAIKSREERDLQFRRVPRQATRLESVTARPAKAAPSKANRQGPRAKKRR
jgi:ATP-dependent RNA helicase DeaD